MAKTKKTVCRKQADEVIVITSEFGEQAGEGESPMDAPKNTRKRGNAATASSEEKIELRRPRKFLKSLARPKKTEEEAAPQADAPAEEEEDQVFETTFGASNNQEFFDRMGRWVDAVAAQDGTNEFDPVYDEESSEEEGVQQQQQQQGEAGEEEDEEDDDEDEDQEGEEVKHGEEEQGEGEGGEDQAQGGEEEEEEEEEEEAKGPPGQTVEDIQRKLLEIKEEYDELEKKEAAEGGHRGRAKYQPFDPRVW